MRIPIELEYKLKSLLAKKIIAGYSIDPNGKVIIFTDPESFKKVEPLLEQYRLLDINIVFTDKIIAL